MRFELTFQRGGNLSMTTLAEAPRTARALVSEGAIETTALQAR